MLRGDLALSVHRLLPPGYFGLHGPSAPSPVCRQEANQQAASSRGNCNILPLFFFFSGLTEFVKEEGKGNGVHFKVKENTHFTCWYPHPGGIINNHDDDNDSSPPQRVMV